MDTIATIVRLSPLLFVTLVPFSEHIPYSVDYRARLAKEAEAERLALEAMKPIITEQERYQMGQIRWYDYKTDLILLQQRIDYTSQELNDPKSSKSRCLGCWIERMKARFKLSAYSNAKLILAYFAQRMSFMFVMTMIAKVSLVAFCLYVIGYWLMDWPPFAYLVDKVSALISPTASQTASPAIRGHVVHVGIHSAQPVLYDDSADDGAVAGGSTADDAAADPAAAPVPVPAFVPAVPAPAPAPDPALATASMGPSTGPIRSSAPDSAAMMNPIGGATGGGSDVLLNATPRRQQHSQLARDHALVSDHDRVDRRQHAASPGLLGNRRAYNMQHQHHVESDMEDDRASRDGSPRGLTDLSDVYGPGGNIDLPPADGGVPRDHSAPSAVVGRVKKRVAFKDDDRSANGQNAANLQLTALPVSYGQSIGSRRSATTTGLAQLNQHAPPIPGHGSLNRRVAPVNGIRSRQTASVGKLHTAL